MLSYYEQTVCASRWSEVVDYGSVVSSWTSEMFSVLMECNGDKIKAAEILRQRKHNKGDPFIKEVINYE